jgi:hypothetical protein
MISIQDFHIKSVMNNTASWNFPCFVTQPPQVNVFLFSRFLETSSSRIPLSLVAKAPIIRYLRFQREIQIYQRVY